MANTPDPQEMVKEALQREAKWYTWENSGLHKQRKSIREGINECKKNVAFFPNWSLQTDNRLL